MPACRYVIRQMFQREFEAILEKKFEGRKLEYEEWKENNLLIKHELDRKN